MGSTIAGGQSNMLSPNFSRAEMQCKCGCGQCDVKPELLAALEKLRLLAGRPVVVLSAFRCPEHNLEVGGRPRSEHPEGEAADVRIPGYSLQGMYDLAKQVPEFRDGGIGVYDKCFIHVDVRKGKARWSQKHGIYLGIGQLVNV